MWWKVSFLLKAEVHGEAVTLSSLVFSTTVLMTIGKSFPRTVLLLDWLLCLALVGGVRLAIRAVRESGRNGHPRGSGPSSWQDGLKDCGKTTRLLPFGRHQEGCTYAPVSYLDSTPVRPLVDEKDRRIIVSGRIVRVRACLP